MNPIAPSSPFMRRPQSSWVSSELQVQALFLSDLQTAEGGHECTVTARISVLETFFENEQLYVLRKQLTHVVQL